MKVWKLTNFSEFDKYAIKSYCSIHGFPESLNLGDITKVTSSDIRECTMVCGGSPCQDFSIAGKQKGNTWKCLSCGAEYNPLTVHWSERERCPKCGNRKIDKTRSSLVVEYLRVVRDKNPSFGIFENVKNLVSKNNIYTFKLFLSELKEYGYNTYYKVLNSKHYGIPQNRERVFVVFIKKRY